MEQVKVNVSWDSNYGAAIDDIACIATGSTFDELKQNFAEALEFHLDGMREDGDEIPAKLQGEYELLFVMDVHALLHYYEGILTRAAIAKVTGINQRQLGHYATGLKTPRPAQREKIIAGIHKIGKDFLQVV